MFRRMPKRGFVNAFARRWAEVNIDTLAHRFPAGSTVDIEAMRRSGLASTSVDGFRVLGRGDIAHALVVKADHFSASARQKIEAAGGKAIGLAKEAAPSEPPPAAETQAQA